MVGHQHFRAPEMNGNREYDQRVDVFSLSKVIQHCLTVQDVSNTLIDPFCQKGLATDPNRRFAASMMGKEIDSVTEGNHMWPFQTLKLLRRFRLAWYREGNDTYIRLSDLCQVIQALADAFSPNVVPSVFETKQVDDENFPGQYCRLKYGERLLIECGLKWHLGILTPKSSASGISCTHMDLSFDLHYHTASQMFNVTALLKTTSLDLARVATWDVKPKVQEVHGDMQWEGNYIDRRSFEEVLARIQNTEVATVHPDLSLLNH